MSTSAFFELGIGTSGLLASQRALVVTGNNVTNANTEGYSRQVVTQKASKALRAGGAGMIGTGTEVTAINRVRDEYLDTKFRYQNNKLAEYSVKSEKMSEISLQFNEPSDDGINSVLSSVFSSLQDLTINSTDSSYFENVTGNAQTLIDTIRNIASQLEQEQTLTNDEVSYTVDEINSIARQIQALNIQINKFEINNNEASSLRDDRDLLISKLSEYVNVTTEQMLVDETSNNYRFCVKINGQELVNHDRVNLLVCEKNMSYLNPEDNDCLYNVKWANGNEFDEYSSTLTGKLKALVEVRDGNGGMQLNGKVKSISYDVNNVPTIVLEGVNRGDISNEGMINIYGKSYVYGPNSYDPETNELTITLTEGYDIPVVFTEGAQARIGSKVEYRGIPYYINKLNEFVRTMASAMNEGKYRNGEQIEGLTGTVNGYTQSGESGIYFFSYQDENGNVLGAGDKVDYEKMNIFNLSLGREIQESSRNIPISRVQNPGESQVDLISELATINHVDIFKEGECSDFLTSIISEVAMDVNQAEKYKEIQDNLVLYTTNKISENSGVVQNEEMTNLVKFQSAYKASARIINVMNTVYDTLINGIFS
ncbi:MAG: flagellar hook-associated protein FlgK [Clostridia bacterium]|nr:flagellar hook-associated protein FlgK [Clostridia bacterium]